MERVHTSSPGRCTRILLPLLTLFTSKLGDYFNGLRVSGDVESLLSGKFLGALDGQQLLVVEGSGANQIT